MRFASLTPAFLGARATVELPVFCPRKDELAQAARDLPALAHMARPLHLLSSNTAASKKTRAVHVHGGAHIPPESLVALGEGVFCTGPELTVVHLAPRCTKAQLMLLIMELMGTYAIQPKAARGMFARESPLMTPQSLDAFLRKAPHIRGAGMVRAALQHVRAGAASPMESKLYLRTALPHQLGGAGLPVLELNRKMEAPRIASGQHNTRLVDIPIGTKGVLLADLEYNGGDHATDARRHRDAIRQNDIMATGVPVFVIEKRQYGDAAYMDAMFAQIRKVVGLPPWRPSEAEAIAHACAREQLLHDLRTADGLTCFGLKDPR